MYHKVLVIFVTFLICFVSESQGFFGYTRKYNTHDEPFIPHTNRVYIERKAIQEKWIEQRLNHFDLQDNRRWQMRYLVNDEHTQPGGPIFIYVGGEWTISAGSISAGTHIYDMAKELNGTLFYTEHRYYGRSHPTEDTSTENLRFLNIDQALADLAHFIQTIKSTDEFRNAGVIMAGGSYSATMVAWMMQKYPHLVNGCWASSAPLQAQIDFFEYKEVMTNSIRNVGGEECLLIIENAFKQMEELVRQQNVSDIRSAFRLCFNLELPGDVEHFFYEISDIVAGLVQSHRAGRIENACTYMKTFKEQNSSDDMFAFGAWVKKDSLLCLDMNYERNIKKFRETDWAAEANRQMRQWIYQTCSEYAWFQTSTSQNQIFGSSFPVDYFVRMCQDLYDFPFNLTIIEQNVNRTNIRYGGFNPAVKNVYFTHGDLDPWHPMGILEDLNEFSPVRILPLAAHVSDFGQISDYDSDEMRASKELIRQLVHQWLNVTI